MESLLCDTLDRLEAETPTSASREQALSRLREQLGCAVQP
jgi:hypothetical protein